MSQSLPIACSLSAGDLRSRLAELRALGGDGLESVTQGPGRAVLRFRTGPDILRRVEAAAAAERECCAFLDLRVESGPEAIVLTIAAPNGGGEVVRDLVEAFQGA